MKSLQKILSIEYIHAEENLNRTWAIWFQSWSFNSRKRLEFSLKFILWGRVPKKWAASRGFMVWFFRENFGENDEFQHLIWKTFYPRDYSPKYHTLVICSIMPLSTTTPCPSVSLLLFILLVYGSIYSSFFSCKVDRLSEIPLIECLPSWRN